MASLLYELLPGCVKYDLRTWLLPDWKIKALDFTSTWQSCKYHSWCRILSVYISWYGFKTVWPLPSYIASL